ncbi:MAG: DUF1326 domain-containing protein [Gaiellaceae bacterium]
MAWKLEGDYFENCSCDILCPCLTSYMQEPADTERCLVPLVCRVDDGNLDDVRLDGLCFIMVVDSPAIMAEGNWRLALYIDERATPEQQEALGQILSGDLGGVPGVLAPLIGEVLGTKLVPITYVIDGHNRRVEVPGIMEFEVEGVVSPETGEVLEILNTLHPMGTNLPITKSVKGVYDDADYDFAFDNTGKNGHYRAFSWSG